MKSTKNYQGRCVDRRQEISDRFAACFQSADMRPLDEWAPDNVDVGSWSPWPGKLSFDQTPQLIPPLRAIRRETCHRLTVVAAAAGGKSTIGETFLSWLIKNAPGFTCWFSQTKETAKEFAETRIWPFLMSCPQVVKLLPDSRHKQRTMDVLFPHMSFLIRPANQTSAQSKHIRYLFCDEPWLYKPGILMQLHKRTTKFAHNRKILELSTGSILGDETDQAYNAGTKREWQFTCYKCGKMWVPPFSPERLDVPGGVKWEPESKLESGIWDFDRVRKTAYYECPFCRERYAPTEENQYRLNRPDSYTSGPEDAEHESFHWPAWVSDFRLLGDFAVEFLQAKAAIKRGSTELLQEFVQKREARAWDIAAVDAEPMTEIESDYRMGDHWPEATARVITVDVQKFHMWLLCRDWAPGPRSRLVTYEKVLTWDEIRKRQLELGVDNILVFIDSSHFTELVYGQCCRFGWNAIKGEPAPNGFLKKEGESKRYVPVIESNGRGQPAQLPADARFSSCTLWRVSEEMTAGSLHLFRTGRAKGWTIPRNPPADYSQQMAARVRRARQHKATGQTVWEWFTIGKCGEHAWDCERYQCAPTHIGGILEGLEPETQIEKEEK